MQKKVIFPLVALGAAAVLAATVGAAGPNQPQLSPVSSANSKSVGFAPASRLSGELQQIAVAQGAMKLENPQGIVTHYGYENDTPSAGDPSVPQMVPVGASQTEAQKTEPDKNTYLVFKRGLKGADASYDYGTHFLYQGHENAATVNGAKQGYITRINLDADTDHRVTLLAAKDVTGAPIATIDGSTWDPFAERLILTTENPLLRRTRQPRTTRPRSRTSRAHSAAAATKESRTTPTATSGSSRTSAARTSPAR